MNKKKFIDQKVEKNKLAFGRWHSTEKPNSASHAKLMLQRGPQNETEALQHGNALANTGNYPVGTSECFNVGISGECGPKCFVYLKGECDEPGEMVERLDGSDELTRHEELYGKKR